MFGGGVLASGPLATIIGTICHSKVMTNTPLHVYAIYVMLSVIHSLLKPGKKPILIHFERGEGRKRGGGD